MGVGKTSVSWAVHESLDKSVMLDGDYIGAVHPFKIYDSERTGHLYHTLQLLISHHREYGYRKFIINYVFESAEQLGELTDKLAEIEPEIHCFWIYCKPEEHEKRVRNRSSLDLEWELKRFPQLSGILETASKNGFIGLPVNTTGLSVKESAERILNLIPSPNYLEG